MQRESVYWHLGVRPLRYSNFYYAEPVINSPLFRGTWKMNKNDKKEKEKRSCVVSILWVHHIATSLRLFPAEIQDNLCFNSLVSEVIVFCLFVSFFFFFLGGGPLFGGTVWNAIQPQQVRGVFVCFLFFGLNLQNLMYFFPNGIQKHLTLCYPPVYIVYDVTETKVS